jgi:putative transposase
MPRLARSAPGGLVYHVLNRSAGRVKLFRTDKDFLAFQDLLLEAHERLPIPLLAWCVMGTHWHFVARPREDGELTAFFRWLTHTHAMRWRVAHHSVGHGPVYQGRFKSFPVQADPHLLTLLRYVERNPLTAGLVERAQDWQWGSLWARQHGPAELRAVLSDWPVERPADWVRHVNRPLTDKELERVRASVERGRPFGDEQWVTKTVRRLHLEHTVRREGRPRKREAADGAAGYGGGPSN